MKKKGKSLGLNFKHRDQTNKCLKNILQSYLNCFLRKKSFKVCQEVIQVLNKCLLEFVRKTVLAAKRQISMLMVESRSNRCDVSLEWEVWSKGH